MVGEKFSGPDLVNVPLMWIGLKDGDGEERSLIKINYFINDKIRIFLLVKDSLVRSSRELTNQTRIDEIFFPRGSMFWFD